MQLRCGDEKILPSAAKPPIVPPIDQRGKGYTGPSGVESEPYTPTKSSMALRNASPC